MKTIKEPTLIQLCNWLNSKCESVKMFDIIDGDSAIVPVMLYDAKLAQNMANQLLKKGIYVIGFFFPVVPKEKARIRVQLSAAHTIAHLDRAIAAFVEVGKELKVI